MRLAALLIINLASCSKHTPSPPDPIPTPLPPAARGHIAGVVRLAGKVKKPHGPPGNVFPMPCPDHPMRDESLILGNEQSLGNVFIAISKGAESVPFSNPELLAYMTEWCILLEPRVMGVRAGQSVVFLNGEARAHNVHAQPQINREFNRGHMNKDDEITIRFDLPEPAIRIKCDVHPWEAAWIHVVEHPYFAVTGPDGRYVLGDLPPGDYEVTAWHERFIVHTLVSKVKVEAGRTATLDFTFSVAPAKPR